MEKNYAFSSTIMAAGILLTGLNASTYAQPVSNIWNITSYGAKGDGKTLNTKAINQAITECSATGGGTVIVPSGDYLSGPIELLNNVTFHLEAGAVIKGSPKLDDYSQEKDQGSGESLRAGLLTARNANAIAITGLGVIDGNGMAFVDFSKVRAGSDYEKKYTRQGEDFMNPKYGTGDGPLEHGERPGNLIRFFDCTNVLISGVTIQNSPTWTIQVARCDRVNITGAGINSFGSDRRVPNDDGMDLVESRYVHVSDCDIQTGDDCIALFGSEKVTVSNCTLSSRSCAVRVGFTRGDIRDCVFANLVIHDSNRGLGVFVRGAGSVENVLFSDIVIKTRLFTGHWWGKGEPIQVSAIPWDPKAAKIGQIKNIRFRNIVAESESGIIVYGCEQSVIKDLSFHDVKVQISGSPLQESYGGNFDLRSSSDMASAMFAHDIPAFYCQYVDGLEIHGLEIEWADNLPAFFKHGIQCKNFNNIEIDGLKGRPAHRDGLESLIALSNGSRISICNSKAGKGTDVFLSYSELVKAGLFSNNDLTEVQKVCEPAKLPFHASGNLLPNESFDRYK